MLQVCHEVEFHFKGVVYFWWLALFVFWRTTTCNLKRLASLQGVEKGLSEQIGYLTQVATGQPHEGSTYGAEKVFEVLQRCPSLI